MDWGKGGRSIYFKKQQSADGFGENRLRIKLYMAKHVLMRDRSYDAGSSSPLVAMDRSLGGSS